MTAPPRRLRENWEWLVLGAIVVLTALEWPAATALLRDRTGILIYALASIGFSIDALDLALRVYLRQVQAVVKRGDRVGPASIPLEIGEFTPYQMRLHLRPYALVASVYNLGSELDAFLAAAGPFRAHLWVIDDASTDDTFARLRAAGVNCVKAERNCKKPAAIRALLPHLPREIATVVVMDPDTRILPTSEAQILDLERVLFEFQRSRLAAVCPRVILREDGWLVRMQEIEYAMACALGRKSLGDQSITSGVSIYRRDALEQTLERHSLSVYAEDLKNAILLLSSGERIYYDGRFVVETEGKRTWKGWFSQRVGWYFGLIKVYTENFDKIVTICRTRPLMAYQFLIYVGLFGLLAHPLRLASLVLIGLSVLNGADNAFHLRLIPDNRWNEPLYFIFAFLKCSVIVGAGVLLSVRGKSRKRQLLALPAYFFYSLAHLAPVTVGYLNWMSVGLVGRRVYRDHYDEEQSMRRKGRPDA